MKRQLNEDEKSAILTNIKRLEKETARLEVKLEHVKLMLDKVLFINYEEKMEEYEKIRKEIQSTYSMNLQTITTLKNQIVEGVEKKGGK